MWLIIMREEYVQNILGVFYVQQHATQCTGEQPAPRHVEHPIEPGRLITKISNLIPKPDKTE